MKKVEKEFQELLFTKTEGRILEQLTVSSRALSYCVEILTCHEAGICELNWNSSCENATD